MNIFKRSDQKGFTLIEMSISLIITGIIIGTAFSLYLPYLENKKVDLTEDRLQDVYAALEEYKKDRGFYPCPAPLNSNRSDANYGFAEHSSYPGAPATPHCFDTSVAPGDCKADGSYCVRQGNRPDLLPATPDNRVRIGAVPFRELNISERQSYDGYKSRMYYAVTESMARDTSSYSMQNGMINVVDSLGNSISNPQSSTNFIVFSAGKNKVGGFNLNGQNANLCTAPYSGIDIQNCNPNEVSATYILANKSEEGTLNEMDDYLAFDKTTLNQSLEGWRLGNINNGENVEDVYTNRSIKVGHASRAPRYEVDISGTKSDIRVDDAVFAESSLCDYDDTDPDAPITNCISVANLERTCPAGQYVSGIGRETASSTELIQCSPILISCGSQEMIVGIQSDGSPKCKPIPAPTGAPPIGPPPPPTCGTTQSVDKVCSPPASGMYQEFQTLDCDTGNIFPQGDNSSTRCCTKTAGLEVNTATLTYKRNWLCGNYGIGTRTRTRSVNSTLCTHEFTPFNYACSCIPDGVGTLNPQGVHPTLGVSYNNNLHNITRCAERNYTYGLTPVSSPHTGQKCTIRNDGSIIDDGDFENATFIWTLDGAQPDSVGIPPTTARKAGDTCSVGTSRDGCASKNPINENGEHRFYRNCKCEKKAQSSPIRCE